MILARELTLEDELSGDLDFDALARAIPPEFRVRGMFFARLAERLTAEWDALEPELTEPPRGGRYVAFKDYPSSDYSRLSGALSTRLFPRVGSREAMRRLAREDFRVFADSTLGKVVLTVVGDAGAALHKVPFAYSKMAPGPWEIVSETVDASTVRVEFRATYGTWEYQLGQLEGVVLPFGGSPITTVSEPGPRVVRFDVRHRA